MTASTTEIQKLNLGPGDVLIIKMDAATKPDIRNAYKKTFQKMFPNNSIVIMDRNVDLVVMDGPTAEQIVGDLNNLIKALS